MHAQLIRSSSACEQVIPALREEPGFAGAMSFVDRESGDSMLIVLWSTAEHAHHPVPIAGCESVTLWEIGLRV